VQRSAQITTSSFMAMWASWKPMKAALFSPQDEPATEQGVGLPDRKYW
jgi:hypothetical protein